jgi:hypothetical protein
MGVVHAVGNWLAKKELDEKPVRMRGKLVGKEFNLNKILTIYFWLYQKVDLPL